MSHPAGDNPIGEELLELIQRRLSESTLTFHTTLPAKRARYADWPEWVLPGLKEEVMDGGIGKLYAHQAELAECTWQGRDAVISTGTSSGKSLGYQLPILTRLAEDQTACALYLTPTKSSALSPPSSSAWVCKRPKTASWSGGIPAAATPKRPTALTPWGSKPPGV